MKKNTSNKYILGESNKKQNFSLNLSKSQQKIFCKSLHDQINIRPASKENTQRSNYQSNTQTQRIKQEGSLSHLIGNFFAKKSSNNHIKQLIIEKSVEESTFLSSKIVEDRLKQKVVQIKELKETLNQKEQEILFLNQQLNVRLAGCPRCDKYKNLVCKLKSHISTQHEQFMNNLHEMESTDFKYPHNSNSSTHILQSLLDNKIQNQKNIVKEVTQFVSRLDSGCQDMDQNVSQLIMSLQQEKQELLQQIYSQGEEIKQLRQNETTLQQRLEQFSETQMKMFQESVKLKCQIPKIDREIQVNIQENVHLISKSKLITSIDKLSNQSDLLISQARSLF